MTVRMTTQILAGGALALALAMPAVYAQGPDMPPSPPVTASPAPVETMPTPPAPMETMPAPETQPIPPASEPTTTKKRRFRIGPEVGVYLPTSSKARDEFGDAWLTLGLGLGSIDTVTTKGQVALDLQFLYHSKGDNHAFLAPIGIGYRTAISKSASNTVYVGATADLYLADLRSAKYNVHSGIRTGFGGSALVGVNFGDSGYLEARYLVVTRIKGFDLSGINFTAGYRF